MANPLILYIGEREAGEALANAAARENGYVYLPSHLMQALGMYITYLPHIVVIDMKVNYAEAAYEHLRSVDAKPIILLTDKHVRSTTIHTLPRDVTPSALLAAVQRVSPPLVVPNGVLRYA